MTYQVLARKWRPKGFSTLVGQEHVVRALTNALEQKRLHHAYLFTGTRGVGKTTLSRILAKAINCESGITAVPCGVCHSCSAIDEGRFVDYVEMDAASNRGVDEMTSLLEKAIYAPADARFKVYMIDEVHMLSGHAFNAMLKTLEEPPTHVKFILATTDPQKIPVTVLSRCLQFNLKQMPAGQIVSRLAHILSQEEIKNEPKALRLLAKAASGSMRDALSLTDQAITYADGTLSESVVRDMLGAIDQHVLVRLLDALKDNKHGQLLTLVDEMAENSFSFSVGLQDLCSLLYKIALVQYAPDVLFDDWVEIEDIRRLATAFSAETVQLYYQIATRARGDLLLAPDEYTGFSMALLRMAAFTPLLFSGTLAHTPLSSQMSESNVSAKTSFSSSSSDDTYAVRHTPRESLTTRDAVASTTGTSTSLTKEAKHTFAASSTLANRKMPILQQRSRLQNEYEDGYNCKSSSSSTDAEHLLASSSTSVLGLNHGRGNVPLTLIDEWPALAEKLPMRGLAKQLACQSELIEVSGEMLRLRVPLKQLTDASTVDKLRQVLIQYFNSPVELHVEIGATNNTAAAIATRQVVLRQHVAEQSIANDPMVSSLIDDFGAKILPGTIRPIE
ncbi:DNA polymerase III subunit gamma/tau [Candidatus Pandoraea novymonadis]|uniref:DNA polymerase III subunit gamma/tau n=1 Tax=Candidatus Pandoraea novymonadis TaxID=1808959 RepID=A0ABX5FE42_9BURK|nr:DNA polymerase III subunit gamma/tau [Candidatus Pandoraea novymonadis]PSB91919.1 DNA polymerase III subunit tau [Candidatus Pandoraea novymonadis]